MTRTAIPRTARGLFLVAAGLILAGAAWFTHEHYRPTGLPAEPRDGGLIYCRTLNPPSSGVGGIRCMTPDGSVTTSLCVRWEAEPSIYLHGGERWFLQTGAASGPNHFDGMPRRELFAVTNSGRSVQLTDVPDLQPAHEMSQILRWTKGDRRVSFVALDRSCDGPVDAAIYAVDVCWQDGEPLPCHEAPEKAVGGLMHRWFARCPRTWVSLEGYDWSPDGKRLAYANGASLLRVIEPGTGKTLWTLPDAHEPSWSPDGKRIAVTTYRGIEVVNANDGLNRKVVVPNRCYRNRCALGGQVWGPRWSPRGTDICFSSDSDLRWMRVCWRAACSAPEAGEAAAGSCEGSQDGSLASARGHHRMHDLYME